MVFIFNIEEAPRTIANSTGHENYIAGAISRVKKIHNM